MGRYQLEDRWLPWLVLAALATVSCRSSSDQGVAGPAHLPGVIPPSSPSTVAGETATMKPTSTSVVNKEATGKDRPKPSDAKDPEPPAVTLAALERVASCDAAVDLIRARALATMNARLDALKTQTPAIQGCPSAAAAPGIATPPPAPSAPATNGATDSAAGGAKSTSMTNNQVAGVDEADFIKNDDKYLYAAMNGALRIVEAWPAATAHEVANVELEGTPKKLFVSGNRALVYVSVPRTAAPVATPGGGAPAPSVQFAGRSECTYGYDCEFGGDGTATALLVFDITDRAVPKQVRRIDLSGSLLAARRIDSAVHTVVVTPELAFPGVIYNTYNGYCGTRSQAELDAQIEELRKKNTEIITNTPIDSFLPAVREGGVDYAADDCDSLYRELEPTGTAFTTLVSVDMATSEAPAVATILSKPGAVYASADALYMAVPKDAVATANTPRKLSSAIHKFRIGTDPEATAYAASGEVKGHVLNQFSMDEYKGQLRVATSWGRVPSPDVHSTISVLGQREHELAVLGLVDDIAPSEDIRSVRFDGDRGFIVTFKKTDPLYAFDLSNPTAPRITGELKIPGFSTYMHMLDENHLLTIGYDAADQGNFAFFTGVLLQIFDISNPAQPTLAHKTVIGTRGSSSEALTNHLAFTLFQGKLAVPMTICEGGGTNGMFGTDMTFSGLMIFDVSVESGLRERGRVAHPAATGAYDNAGCTNWWTRASSVVQRSVFMDDFVYSIAQDIVRVQNVEKLGKDVAAVKLAP
ncbi:MAG TPA: beta-propeller domain-containing protein [Polyangiales bacterium]|nr:beta-propeller domain-containing protein [Polyangiales bacterium]